MKPSRAFNRAISLTIRMVVCFILLATYIGLFSIVGGYIFEPTYEYIRSHLVKEWQVFAALMLIVMIAWIPILVTFIPVLLLIRRLFPEGEFVLFRENTPAKSMFAWIFSTGYIYPYLKALYFPIIIIIFLPIGGVSYGIISLLEITSLPVQGIIVGVAAVFFIFITTFIIYLLKKENPY